MVDKSRARSKNGAGLGLALCVKILKIHHSKLKIESIAGKGSCFSFLLPAERAEAVRKTAPEAEDVQQAVPGAEAVQPGTDTSLRAAADEKGEGGTADEI
mgnify:FL=1